MSLGAPADSAVGPRVLIIGAGASGLAMAAKLIAAGFANIAIYEKADEVGGTWRENTYPGVRCDVPSRLYSFSFAPSPDWSQTYAAGPEIQAYLLRVADELDLRRRIRFGKAVDSCRWNGTQWELSCQDGTRDVGDVVVAATGILHHPKRPAIPGLETFAGPVLHTAQWDHAVDLTGQRVAVVGTGSSGVQVTTALAEVAGHVSVLQRTPQWVLPLPNFRTHRTSRWLRRRFPGIDRLSQRAASWLLEHTLGAAVIERDWRLRLVNLAVRANLRFGVRDPELRAKLRPPDLPMCRRLIMSPSYYKTLQRPHVSVEVDPIEHVSPTGIRCGGRDLDVDAIVLATGFEAHRYFRPMRLTGENGLDIEDVWRSAPFAHKTVALPGFPGFFMLVGPHSPVGNHSVIAVAETQADYIVAWIQGVAAGRWPVASPSAAATSAFNEELRAALPDTIWMTGCAGWYLGADGLPELYPWSAEHHRRLLSAVEPADVEARPRRDRRELEPAHS